MLNESQILLLNNLVYRNEFSNPDKYGNNEGKTVKEILETVKNSEQQLMTPEEWDAIYEMAKSDPEILELKVTNMCYEADTGAKMACFVDPSGQAYAVFAGTGANEWRDDCIAGQMTDSPQQEKALAWIESLPEEYQNIVVSGHSKGGNKAMYVAVLSDRVAECYAFDGEGFSAEFCKKYEDKIAKKKANIHLRASYKDFVNTLLYPIAGDIKYVVNDEGVADPREYHCPNALFKYENGEIVYSIGEFGAQDPTMEMLGEFSRYLLENATEAEKILALSVLGELLTQFLGGKNGVVREDIKEMFGSEAIEILLSYLTMYLRELLIKDPKKYYEYQQAFENMLLDALNAKESFWYYLLLAAGIDIRGAEDLVFFLITSGAAVTAYNLLGQGLLDDVVGRDFSQATKEIMLQAAKETEDEEWWQVTRWDCWYKIEKAFGQLKWDNYTGKVDEYYRKLIDMNDASVGDINKIFEKVYKIDKDKGKKMNEYTDTVRNDVWRILNRVSQKIVPKVDQY